MWAQLISAVIGVWLMVSPSVLGYGRPMATSAWVVGPLVASFGLVAAWEITRGVRWVNVALGAWLILSPLLLGTEVVEVLATVSSGVLIALLSLVRGRRERRYAGGWKSLGRAEPRIE